MKKTTFRQRISNARNAFFDDETFEAHESLSFIKQNENLQYSESEDISQQNSVLETILKQIFFFFPGTFILYILSLVLTIGLIDVIFGPSRIILGIQDFAGISAVFSAAILMAWLGLGDVRNPKHFVIPASIIIVGIFFGAVAAIASNHFSRSIFINGYPFYFLPLALIVPFLAKGWVDGKTENKKFD